MDPMKRLSLDYIARHRWLVGHIDTTIHQKLLDDMGPGCEVSSKIIHVNDAVMEHVVTLSGCDISVTTVRDSVTENKCDDLAAMSHLLLGPGLDPDLAGSSGKMNDASHGAR